VSEYRGLERELKRLGVEGNARHEIVDLVADAVRGQVDPQATEAEEYVLGAMMLSAKAIDAALENLDASDFYRESHARIFRAAIALHERGEPVEWLSVRYELEAREELDEVGEVRIGELAHGVFDSTRVRHYGAIVRRKARQRTFVRELSPLLRAARNGGVDPLAARGVLERVHDLLADPDGTAELGWLESAADLLAEPDSGPTPFLVQDLVVDEGLVVIQGPEKVGKTYLLLELALAIVTGRPAFERFSVPQSGPAILVLEESGRDALHRRLDRLRRGYAFDVDKLADLYFAARLGVRLNERHWQQRLLFAAATIQPRAILFDPFVRVKGTEADENLQRDLAPALDYLIELQKQSGAAVGFSHHTGHEQKHLRGSSDLEAWWESKLVLTTEQDGRRKLSARHRDAADVPGIHYRMLVDEAMSTVRHVIARDPQQEELEARVAAYLNDHPEESANDVHRAFGGRKQDVLAAVKAARET
jgi:hypothetical protein